MTSNVIMDVVVAALLVLFAVMGARRGLLKSVAGLVILILSLAGAALIANLISPVVTAVVQPVLVELVEEKLEKAAEELDIGGLSLPEEFTLPAEITLPESITLPENFALPVNLTLPEGISVPEGTILPEKITLPEGFALPAGFTLPKGFTLPENLNLSELLKSMSGALAELDIAGQLESVLRKAGIDPELVAVLLKTAVKKMEETGSNLTEALVQVMVETVVHAIVFLLVFILLNILLRILLAAMDIVLLLPGLRTLNQLGGAAVALIEGGLLMFLLVWAARQCAVDVTGVAEGTVVFRFFVNNTPLSVLSLL